VLHSAGRQDLADRIIHVSEVEGDGAGYDILSYTMEGDIKFIEVKSTTGGAGTPFVVTLNELVFSKQHSDNYYLHSLFELDRSTNTTRFYKLKGCISDHFTLDPIQFRARK